MKRWRNNTCLSPQPSPSLDHLSEKLRIEVRGIWSSVFQENPGYTTVITHDIAVKYGAAVKQMSYHIPVRFLEPLKNDIDLMRSLGFIGVSQSEWCNPIVLVPKKMVQSGFALTFATLIQSQSLTPIQHLILMS